MSQKTAPISSGYLAGYTNQSANAVAIGNNAGQVSQGTGSVAIGYQAGQHSQGVNSMAIGYQAGVTGQGNASFAMGFQAGLISQGNNALAIGYVAGQTGQGPMAEAIGYGAGQFGQGTGAIALGYMAGNTGQGAFAEAIGYQAGASNQGTGAFAVGYQAGASSQGANALALGYMAGVTGQSANATAAGYMAGAYGQNANTVAFGYMAGATGQGTGAFAMGFQAGNWNQGQNAIAMGFQAGMTGQGASAIAVGYQAGVTGQNANAVAVGFQAGEFFQGAGAVAIGTNAGMTGQGANALAVGANAGSLSQGDGAIAFGASAGQFSQGQYAMALGYQAGMTGQKANAVAVGYQAGQSAQGDNAFAMGYMAGNTGQGQNALAVGYGAGQLGQGTNAMAVGYAAGTNQGSNAVAIGYQAGMTGQGFGAFAMGFQSGQFGQKSGALAVGYGAGMITQGTNAMAVGYGAGMYSQGDNGFAVGFQAGVTGQGSNALAMGNGAGASLQGVGAIAVGFQAGMTGQGTNAVAIGYQAGMTGQGSGTVAIGYQAGATGQGQNSSAIGYQAGQFFQGQNSIAMGFQAGMTGQGLNAVAIGNYAGAMRQTSNAFALGSQAGQTNQGSGAMGLGVLAGQNNQGENAFAAGVAAGQQNQGMYAMALGHSAGQLYQGTGAFAAGWQAGFTGQNANAAAIGYQAGMYTQGTGAFALGYQAGMTGQGLNAVALGYQAGQSTQGNFAVAVGNLAGATGQNTNALAIGNFAGQFGQGAGSVAIGFQAGMTGQKANTVAIGNSAGQFNQGANALAIGFQAGMTGQNDNAMALGNSAGQFAQGTGAFAIGFQAGVTGQRANAMAIGFQAGELNQGTGAFAAGFQAGELNQGTGAFAAGFQAGQFTQGTNSLALGFQAGITGQGTNSVAMGFQAGELQQGANAFAVGYQAGELRQGTGAFAAGFQAGQFTQGTNALAVGFQAGVTGQGTGAVAMGFQAGETNQGANAFAVGYQAGELRQGTGAFAAGYQAGQSAQGAGAVAIGFQAGYTGQGANSIAIGNQAGVTGITPNSIVLNASGAGFFATGPTGAFYVSPVSTVADSGMIKGNILVYGENNQIMKTPATIDKDGGFFYTNSSQLSAQSQVSSLVVSDGRVQTALTSFAAGNNAGTTGMYNISGKSTCISEDGKYVLSIISNFLSLSSDSGTTFVTRNIVAPDSIAMSSSGQYMLVSTFSSPSSYDIYISSDYGTSWRSIMTDLKLLFNTTKNNAIWNSPSVVGITTGGMIITSNLTSFKSADNGATWTISKEMVSHYFPFNDDFSNRGNSSSPISFTNNSNNVTLNNADYYIGSKSAYFGNANSGTPTHFLTATWDLVATATFTISCRFLLSNEFIPGNTGAVIWCSGNAGANNFFVTIDNTLKIFCGSNNSSIANYGEGKGIKNGVWYYLVVTLKSNLLNMYIDGELFSSVYLNKSFASNNNKFTLGATPDAYINSGFNGCIDDFRIYEGVDIGLELMQNLSTTTRLLNSITPTYPIQMYNPSIYPSLLVLLNADDATIGIANFQQSGASSISTTSPFSGSNSYLFNGGTYSGGLTLPSSFTISCVLRFSSTPASSVPFALLNSSDSSKSIALFMTSGGAFSITTGSSPASIITSGCAPPINTWYYIAITVSSIGVNLYINGYPNGTYTTSNLVTSAIYGNTVNLVLGALNTSNANSFRGNIDDFRIYGGVMSSYQINTIYTDMTKITPVYYASFNDATTGNTLLNNLPSPTGAGTYSPRGDPIKISGNYSLEMTARSSGSGTHIKSLVNFYGFSVSFWIRFKSLRLGVGQISLPFLVADVADSFPSISLCQHPDTKKLTGRTFDGVNERFTEGFPNDVAIDTWYHITIVQDFRSAMFYVNGISIGSLSVELTNWRYMYLGRPEINQQFDGYFDEFRLYQASLSQHQVTALYTSYSTSPALTGSSVTLPFPLSLKNTSYTSSGGTQLITTLDKVYTTSGGTDTILKTIYGAFNPVIVGNRGAFCTEKIIYYYTNSFSSEQTAINVLNSTDTFASISLAPDGTIYAGSTSGMLKNSVKISDITLFVTRNNAIAIGSQAGQYGQGFNSIAIGNKAGQALQPSNTIIINANDTALNASALNGCFIAPIASYINSSSKTFDVLVYGTDNQIVKIGPSLTSLTNFLTGAISLTGTTMTQASKSQENLFYLTKYGTASNINSVSAALSLGVEDNNSGQNTSGRFDIKLSGIAGAGNNWGSNADITVATFAVTEEGVGGTRRYLHIPSRGNIFMAADGSSSIYFMGGSYTPGNTKSAVNCYGRFFGVVDPGTNSSRIIQDFNDRVEWRRTDITGSAVADTKMQLGSNGLNVYGVVQSNSVTLSSDQRIKQNIEDADPAKCMATISAIRMRRYEINSEITQNTIQDRHQIGVIAQELETVLPKAIHVQERFGIPDFKMVDKDQIYMTLVGAVQQLIKDNATQQQQIKDLLATTATLQAQIATLSPSSQVSSTGPTGSTRPTESTGPTGSTVPAEFTAPTESTGPSESTGLTGSTGPSGL